LSHIRLPLTIACVLTALLSLVNVSAYRQATVTDGLSIQVVNTGSAALALAAGTGNAANQVSAVNGTLQLDFRKGYAGGIHSFRQARTGPTAAADVFQMRQVFTITNNGAYCQDVSVYVSSGTATNLTGIYGRLYSVWPTMLPATQLAGAGGGQIPANKVKLQPSPSSNQMVADFYWQAATPVAASGNFGIQVFSTQSATCP